MTATVSNDRSDGPDPAFDVATSWHDGVLVVGDEQSPDVAALVPAAAALTGEAVVPVVLDLDAAAPSIGDAVDLVTLALAERTPQDRAVLLLTVGSLPADPPSPATRLADVSGRVVIAASTRAAAHPQGGFVALDDGRFDGTDGAGFGALYPRPDWAEHVPAQSAFVGEAGLLDPVPAGVWIHADPSARSPQQRLGRLVHGVPPVPLWPVIVLGTPGGPALDLDAVAVALTSRPALLERAVVVPFGVSLTELRALADRLGHGFDAVTAMVVTSETGAAVVRTVGRDAHFGWAPLVSRVRIDPGRAVPVATVSRSPVRVEDLGGDTDDIRLDAVPAGLWLRTSASDGTEDDPDSPWTLDVDPDGVRLFVGDPGVATATSLVQRAAALLGRLDPALRQGARIVMVGSAADGTQRPQPAVPAGPGAEPEPDTRAASDPVVRAPLSFVPPTGSVGDLDRVRVREALGPAYGRLGGRTGVVLALEPGRGLGDGSARDDLVALAAVLTHAAGADGNLVAELDAAFADGGGRTALLLCAAVGVESLATHRGIAFVTSAGAHPAVGEEIAAPPFGRLALTRPDVVDAGTVVLAVRCRTVRRLGGLISPDGGSELIAPPGLRLRVTGLVQDPGTGTLVLAEEATAPDTDADWFTGRTGADAGAPELPTW